MLVSNCVFILSLMVVVSCVVLCVLLIWLKVRLSMLLRLSGSGYGFVVVGFVSGLFVLFIVSLCVMVLMNSGMLVV